MSLFHRIGSLSLSTLAAILLVVFDGECEQFKGGVGVKQKKLWMVRGFKEMLDAMGIAWVDVCSSAFTSCHHLT